MSHRILIVDDERALREELAEFFNSQGFVCAAASSAAEALELAVQHDFDVIVTDVRMPDVDGIELVRRLRNCAPETQALVITAHPSIDSVVSALRLGASDYVTKPLVLEDLLHKVRRMIEFRAQKMELRWYRQQLQARYDLADTVGQSEVMKEVYRFVERAAETTSPVLLTGESGTGKELVAHAIHHNGPRKDMRFITVNCAAIPATLLETQLFGHVKGAFTGADHETEGLFAAAAGGTLFLDEIGDLPLESQPKLLRAIENHEILPVGATQPIAVDTRIVSSANKDLSEQTRLGRFREDLFYRLSVLTIHMPPLRDRREDIPALAEYFIQKFNKKLPRRVSGITNEALRRLLQYDWKGNVRELQNVIERAMILEDGDLITPEVLPSTIVERTHPAKLTGLLKEAVREFERQYIRTILRATDGDKSLAAELLGVSLSSLYRRLQEFHDDDAPRPEAQS